MRRRQVAEAEQRGQVSLQEHQIQELTTEKKARLRQFQVPPEPRGSQVGRTPGPSTRLTYETIH